MPARVRCSAKLRVEPAWPASNVFWLVWAERTLVPDARGDHLCEVRRGTRCCRCASGPVVNRRKAPMASLGR